MKLVFTILSILFSIPVWSQLDFKEVKKHLSGATTDFKTVAIGDINNDGRNDLVIGSGYSFDTTYDYNIIIYKQSTDGTLLSPVRFRYPTSYPGLKVLQIADLNNDRLKDIVIGYSDSIAIYYQLNTGLFSKIKSYYSGYTVDGLKTGDLNNDGLTDIAVCHWNSSYINIFTQNVNGGFSIKSVPILSGGYDEIDIADMNGDKLNDVIFMPGQLLQSTLQILYQKPQFGITDSVFLYKYTEDYYPAFQGIGIGDLDNDGRNDLVGSKGGNDGYLLLMYQDSLGTIGNNNVKIPAYDIPTPVEIADLNCDGNNEIIVGHSGWGSVTIYEKDKSQKYSNYLRFNSSFYYYPYSMAVGDLNNDNKSDIVSVDNGANISILYNTSKPTNFNRIDTKVSNMVLLKDTTNSYETIITTIIDPVPACKVNRELQKQIITKYANEYYKGDSLTIRYASLCNSNYTDTITKHFNYTNSKVLSVDTIKTIVSKDQLSISISWIRLNSSINSNDSFYLYSNICWNLSTDQNWLFPSKSSGSGGEMILLAATANFSTSPRSAIVTISGKDVPTLKINVIQEAALPFLSTSSSSIIFDKSVNNTAYFNISSNINWKIVNPIEWINLDKFDGSNNALITITASPNTSNTDRSGIIFIEGDNNITISMAITQLFTIIDAMSKLDKGELKVYPNPFHDKIYLELLAPTQEATVDVLDSTGRKLLSRKLNDKRTEINLSAFLEGIYYMKIITNRSTTTRKIIKE